MRNIHGIRVISEEEARAEQRKEILLKVLYCIRMLLFITVCFLNITTLISKNDVVCAATIIGLVILIAVTVWSICLRRQ